ncbi:MAG: hypothetical protein ABJA66_04585 [Actinomycetota bacterium]
MSTLNPRQGIPVIIKGGSKSGILAKPIEIQANSDFQVTEEFHSQANNWIQSGSDFAISYVESIMIGEMGANLQFCQTSSMAHPLTYAFKDAKGANIFTITEVAGGGNYSLQISVDLPDNYFQITDTSESKSGWTVSLFGTTDAEVYAVEVIDSNNVPVSRLVRMDEADIYLNLEPSF